MGSDGGSVRSWCAWSRRASGPGGWDGHLLGRVPCSPWECACCYRHENSWPPHPLLPRSIAASSTKTSQRRQTGAPPRPMSTPHLPPPTPPHPGTARLEMLALAGSLQPVRCQAPASGFPARVIGIRAQCVCHPPFSETWRAQTLGGGEKQCSTSPGRTRWGWRGLLPMPVLRASNQEPTACPCEKRETCLAFCFKQIGEWSHYLLHLISP